MTNAPRSVLVTGATGFVGHSLLPALVLAGHRVRSATTRDVARATSTRGVDWIRCDIDVRSDVQSAFEGVDAAYFLVHGMGGGRHDYAERESRTTKGTARHAAVLMAEHIFGIPERTSYERLQKQNFPLLESFLPDEEAGADWDLRVVRVALAITATSGLPLADALVEAKHLVDTATLRRVRT